MGIQIQNYLCGEMNFIENFKENLKLSVTNSESSNVEINKYLQPCLIYHKNNIPEFKRTA